MLPPSPHARARATSKKILPPISVPPRLPASSRRILRPAFPSCARIETVEVIRTRRLVLRRFQPEDRAAYLAIRAEPAVAHALGYEPELAVAKTEWFLELNERSWNERGFGAWLVCRDGDPIGHAGLWYVDAFDAVEILYAYSERAWGAGIGTEAGDAVVDLAFGRLGLGRLIALVAPDNVRSRRVVEKLGFCATRSAEHRGTPVIVHERER